MICFVCIAANPIYDESFEFHINLPELALVRFSVLDDDFIGDEFIGQYTIPFTCMQPGNDALSSVCFTRTSSKVTQLVLKEQQLLRITVHCVSKRNV